VEILLLQQYVTIVDNTAPVISDQTSRSALTLTSSSHYYNPNSFATDNCGNPTPTISNNEFDCDIRENIITVDRHRCE
jgi:hypothetical protein